VGAGPSGSYIAGKLSALGHKVLVLEEHPTIGLPVCCTGIIGKECVDHFPVPRSVILKAVNSATIFSPSGKGIRIEKDSPQAYIINRTAFDQVLANQAQGEGAEYLLEAKVKGFSSDDNGVKVEVECRGKKFFFPGRVLVIACGFGSSLPQRLGRIKDFIIAAQAEVEVNGVEEVEVYTGQSITPGSFAWLVPTSQGRGLAGLLSSRPSLYIKPFLSRLYTMGKINSQEVKIGYALIPLEPLPQTYEGRVIVVGEAAGQVKPTTGGGIYYGLIASDIAAEVLHQALYQNSLSAPFLSQYQKEWRRRMGGEMEIGRWARSLYENLSDKHLEIAFQFVTSSGVMETLLQAEDFSFDWHSRIIIKAIKYGALAKLWGLFKTITKAKG